MQQSSSDGPRRLVVMRHAKAEPTAPSDHERALAARGRSDAEEAGRWLREQAISPDLALVSDALRTRQTWEQVAAGASYDLQLTSSAALYAADPDTAFDLIREVDEAITTLVVVGHNPTVAYIAELLDDGEGDVDASMGLVTRGLPTSALAIFTVAGGWADIGPGAGRLEAFHIGEA